MKKIKAYTLVGILIVGIIISLILLPNLKVEGTLLINEIMSSNGDVIKDADGDYEDWIEIYNAGDRRINLKGYALSDNPNKLAKWRLPKIMLESGEHLLIWASGKDKIGENGELHTNFSINSGGEPIFLTAPNGKSIIDRVEAVAIPRNRSYGRTKDGGEEWQFFDQPTPGTSNNPAEGYQEVLASPVFSNEAGFYRENFTLELSVENDAIIYYTLDGSEPTEESLVYTEPIKIETQVVAANHPIQMITGESPPAFPISFIQTASHDLYGEWGYQRYRWHSPTGTSMKAVVVRAKAFKEKAIPSQVVTQTYFIDENIDKRFDLPVISITTDRENFFGYDEGIYITGKIFDEWRVANPDEKVLGNVPANYNARGVEWEKPIHIELFEKNGTLGFSQEAGLRIHGGFTRAWAQKTLRIYAKRDYDKESYFNYEVFPGLKKSNGDGTLQQFKRLILRNSGNDWTYTLFRDALIQDLVRDFKIDTQAYRPAVVYINGEYWGIHNIRERYDQHYFETNYDVEGSDVAIIDITEVEQLKKEESPDIEHYLHMIKFLEEQDITLEENYQYVKTLMDIESFIDYQIAGIYVANTDWIGNNLQLWRLKIEEYQPDAPYGKDGRWRWMLFDTDYGFDLDNYGMYAHNTLDWATTDKGEDRNAPEYTFLLRSLLKNEEFRNQFINRFADVINTNFAPNRVTGKINEMQSTLEHEMQYNIQRWVNFGSVKEWRENVDVMRNFAQERPSHMKKYIMEHFGIAKTVDFIIHLSNLEEGTVNINTITIDGQTPGLVNSALWKGSYFSGIPIEVTAIPKEGYQFIGWEGREDEADTLYIIPWEDFTLRPIFEKI
ncbi:spore coat protein CotH [Clostridium aceticum]|uniref:Spore coat protein CotH n=1 Tax=Clostridium aceticum TaxID=84022 RepID=A0A0G3W880_9CLOT|nr:CotH kinase family protein [Clostridium aceticum]AKL93649.1 spore coat protein CotH [Clostridium aceticum]